MRKFLIMQNKYYKTALNEIKSGEKKTHWIWFIFPQLRGLGVSEMSYKYGLQNLDEAKEYFRNKKLRQNLLEITTELYALKKRNIIKIVGTDKIAVIVTYSVGIICTQAIAIQLKYPTQRTGFDTFDIALKYSSILKNATPTRKISTTYLLPKSNTRTTNGNPNNADVTLFISILFFLT